MSEKVKSNIFEMAVPENICLHTKQLIYLRLLIRYGKIGLWWPSLKMATNAFKGEI